MRRWLVNVINESASSASNQALLRCMKDCEPVLVFRQITSKADREGSTYLIAGLGLIKKFESESGLFRIRGMHVKEVSRYLYGQEVPSDDLLVTALRLESLEEKTALV